MVIHVPRDVCHVNAKKRRREEKDTEKKELRAKLVHLPFVRNVAKHTSWDQASKNTVPIVLVKQASNSKERTKEKPLIKKNITQKEENEESKKISFAIIALEGLILTHRKRIAPTTAEKNKIK